MAAPAGTDFDQISLSSSCEIVDGIAEAVQDHQLALSAQPTHTNLYPNLTHMDVAEEVVFTCMQDSYSMNRDLVVQYKYRKGGCYGDRVGLYKVPNTQPHQCLAYVWVSRGDGVATLGMDVLPKEEGEYLLQYIQGDNTVLETSTTFQMIRDADSGVEKFTPIIKDNDTENNIVEDTSEVPVSDEKQFQDVEAVLVAKAEEVKNLTCRLTDEEARCGELFVVNRDLSREKEEMSRILETEMEKRAKVLEEKAELVDKLEYFSLQIKEANRDRDMAVNELRALIQQQDTLRKELEEYREETGNAEAELISIKQEMTQINSRINEGNLESFEDKIKDLAGNIEIHKRFLKEANGKIEELEKEKSEMIDEKVELGLKLKQFLAMNKSMKEAAEMLEHENTELRERLDNIADSVNVKNNKDIKYRSKICSLEEQIKVLNQQLMEARMSSNNELLKFVKTAPEKQTRSNGESLEKEAALDGSKADHAQEQKNPEKMSRCEGWFKGGQVKGSEESSNNQEHAQTSSTSPSLFKKFPPASAPVNPISAAPVLPNVSLECPFCGDFFPANQKVELECHVEQHMDGMLECPICNLTFEAGFQSLLETHVELHFKSQDLEVEELPLDARGWDLGID